MRNLLIISIILVASSLCHGQYTVVYKTIKYNVESGKYKPSRRNIANEVDKDIVIFKKLIEVQDATHIRLIFSDYNLGENSKLKIESIADNGTQVFNEEFLDIWRGKSAIFNGNAVQVSLIKS